MSSPAKPFPYPGPVDKPNTQTKPMRGYGAATKGNKYSQKSN